jgi:arsenate reductase (thioredoxin)
MSALALAVGRAALVVFVCEHGNVKSLIASRWFDRLSEQSGLALRSVSRGLSPEGAVPAPIALRLGRDGFDVAGFEATALAPADVEHAGRVVFIGVPPPEWMGRSRVPVERWDGIPPASEDYEAARDALRARIAALLRRAARARAR